MIALALDLIWARCCGAAPSAGNAVGHLLDENAAVFRGLGERVLQTGMRPGLEAFLDALPTKIGSFSASLLPELASLELICFSERNDSTLMWSHYSESHTGLVLGFENADDCDSVYKLARPIKYQTHPPQFADEAELAAIVAGNAKVPKEIIDQIIYTKSDQWSYEREWRISSGDGREPLSPFEYAGFFTQELKSVCFGVKASDATKRLLTPLLSQRYPDAVLLQAHRKMSSYSIEIAQLSS